MREAKFWDASDPEQLTHEDIDEAIEYYLEDADLPLPREIVVYGYAPVEIKINSPNILENLLEAIDEEYGNPDNWTYDNPTPAMLKAEREFIDTVIHEYGEPWVCEVVDRRIIDVREWVEKNRPDWFKEGVTIED